MLAEFHPDWTAERLHEIAPTLTARPAPSDAFPRLLRFGNRYALGYADGAALATPWPKVDVFHVHADNGRERREPLARLARLSLGPSLSDTERAWWRLVGVDLGGVDGHGAAWVSEGVARNDTPEAVRRLSPSEADKREPSPMPFFEPGTHMEASELLLVMHAAPGLFLGTPDLPTVGVQMPTPKSPHLGETVDLEPHRSPRRGEAPVAETLDGHPGVLLTCKACGWRASLGMSELGKLADEALDSNENAVLLHT